MRLHSEGRGAHYGAFRGAIESSLRVLYRGDWPARVWGLVPGACKLRVIERREPLLAPGAPPLRVGFASDLHLGPTTPPAVLDAAMRALAHAKLDVLLLGGDYVFLDATADKARTLAELIERVPARVKLAVLGNHDLWTKHALLEDALRRAGARVLVNETAQLPSPHEDVFVVGLDEPWTGHADARAFDPLPPDATVIVLCHSPEAMPLARRALAARERSAPAREPQVRRALYVCGHTHGGHVALPWGPIVVPGKIGRQHHAGQYSFDELTMHVSRGVGATEVATRTFAPPDVLVFELHARSFGSVNVSGRRMPVLSFP